MAINGEISVYVFQCISLDGINYCYKTHDATVNAEGLNFQKERNLAEGLVKLARGQKRTLAPVWDVHPGLYDILLGTGCRLYNKIDDKNKREIELEIVKALRGK